MELANLADDGIIIEDDVQPMALTEHYNLPRPFGKATLILPMLILANYLANREEKKAFDSVTGDPASISYSVLISQLVDVKFPANVANFIVIGTSHRMLLYGSKDYISEVANIKLKQPQPVSISFRSRIKRKLKKLLG